MTFLEAGGQNIELIDLRIFASDVILKPDDPDNCIDIYNCQILHLTAPAPGLQIPESFSIAPSPGLFDQISLTFQSMPGLKGPGFFFAITDFPSRAFRIEVS